MWYSNLVARMSLFYLPNPFYHYTGSFVWEQSYADTISVTRQIQVNIHWVNLIAIIFDLFLCNVNLSYLPLYAVHQTYFNDRYTCSFLFEQASFRCKMIENSRDLLGWHAIDRFKWELETILEWSECRRIITTCHDVLFFSVQRWPYMIWIACDLYRKRISWRIPTVSNPSMRLLKIDWLHQWTACSFRSRWYFIPNTDVVSVLESQELN